MEINTTLHGNVYVVAPLGNIDSLTAAEYARAFDAGIAQGRYQLVADLHQVGFMSSSGLRILLQAARDVRLKGGDLRLACPDQLVEKMLQISGFTRLLKIFPSVDEAVASFVG